MDCQQLNLEGARLLKLDRVADSRGSFTRTFCIQQFKNLRIEFNFTQCNFSENPNAKTLRGLHYQTEPYAEDKLIYCTRGQCCDVIVDLRKDSQTYGQYHLQELSGDDNLALFVPKGFAHGFVSLTENTNMAYWMSAPYQAECAAGIRWNSPALAIPWPVSDPLISEKDQNLPNFQL